MSKKIRVMALFALLLSGTSVFAQCTEAKDAEMAKYKRRTETQDAQGCSQCAMLALYFCSARHTVKSQDKAQVSKMINACKSNIRQMGQPYCCPEYLNKEPEWGKALNGSGGGAGQSTSAGNSVSGSAAEMENKLNDALALGQKLQSSYYSMQEVNKNRNELNELSSLKGKFNSIEEIETAFQAKFNNIANAVEKTVNSENAAISNNINTINSFVGGDELVGQGLGLVAGLANSIGAEERRRAYEERLRKQKEEQIRKFKAMKASQVVEVRKTLLETFPDGGLPSSSAIINEQVIYMFSYSTNPHLLLRDKPAITVTNVFPVKRNKDGMWIYKNTLVKDLRKHFATDDIPVLLGYFVAEKDANSLRDSFLYLASQCDFDLKFTTYQSQSQTLTNNKNNDEDFWKN